MTVIPFAAPVQADPMERLAKHQRTCLWCRSTPQDQPPSCGQRIRLEYDLGYIRAPRKEEL